MSKVKCKLCGDIIESKHIHDFKWCKCKETFIDGGNSGYIRTTIHGIILKESSQKKENNNGN